MNLLRYIWSGPLEPGGGSGRTAAMDTHFYTAGDDTHLHCQRQYAIFCDVYCVSVACCLLSVSRAAPHAVCAQGELSLVNGHVDNDITDSHGTA